MSGERGQSLVLAALVLGIAAAAAVAVHTTQERLVAGLRDERAGEAAAAAAGAAVADLHLARVRALGRGLDAAETERFVTEDAVLEAALEAALAITRAQGAPPPSDVAVRSFGVEIEVHLTLAGRRHIALIGPPT